MNKQKTKLKKTEIGMIPEDWEVKKIGDLVTHKKGFAFKSSWYRNKGKKIIKVSDLTSDSINFSNCVYLDEAQAKDFDDWEIIEDDIIITTVGSWPSNPASVVGKVVQVPKISETCLLNQNAVRIRAKSSIDQLFLYYLMKSKEFLNYLIGNAQGSANQASITLNDIFSFEFLLPPLPEQQEIAHILSTLDEKIELLQKQNKTLEAIGQAIFKKWFVDERKDEWEISTIGKEIKTILGGTPDRTKSEYWNGDINWINSGAINDFPVISPTEKISELGLKNSATQLMPKKTIVLPFVISVGKVVSISLLAIETTGNQSVLGIVPNEKFSSAFVYYYIQNQKKEIYSSVTGGAQQHINKSNVDKTPLIIPDRETLKKFDNLTEPIINKILSNSFNMQTLTQIRDSLLPKLMSGKIRVPVR